MSGGRLTCSAGPPTHQRLGTGVDGLLDKASSRKISNLNGEQAISRPSILSTTSILTSNILTAVEMAVAAEGEVLVGTTGKSWTVSICTVINAKS